MFSGEDSSGDPFSSKNQFAAWALSQAACNTSNENVDWAVLAQQWIQMKESCSISNYGGNDDNIPAAPPPPQISSREFEEQGEAPMEVVKEDEAFGQGQNSIQSLAYANPSSWQSTWFQNQAQFCPTWTSSAPLQMPSQAVQIPPPVQPMNTLKEEPNISSGLKIQSNISSNEIQMDAARRKTLPAWIREGLEKMEREKLKQLERSREIGKQEMESKEQNVVLEKHEEKKLLFQDNSDKSDDEDELEEDNGGIIDSSNERKEVRVEKSKEERIEEMMLIVRKALTELLLEVTNEEILSIAQETFRKYKAKASSVQVFRKSALTSITSKLGLGAYGDSDSDNSDDESNKSDQETDGICDSEEELKESIRARRDAFKLIAQRIELSCMESEEKEYRRNNIEKVERRDSVSNSSSKKGVNSNNYDNESGEAHADKKNNVNGKRLKERTSRFSSVKDFKYKTNFYSLPTETATTSTAISSSIASSSHGDNYDKKKSNQITKRRVHSSDMSSSTESIGSDTSNSRYRRSKSSREKFDRSKSRNRYREKSRDKDIGHSRDKIREQSRDRDSGKYKYRERNRSSGSGKDKEKNREKNSERHRDKDQEKSRNDNKSDSKDHNREKSRDSENDKTYRGRHRERSKEREEIRDKYREHERDRDRNRDRHYKKSKTKRKENSHNSSDSDEYYLSQRNRHSREYRSRSNTRSQSPRIRSPRSRSRSH